MVARVVLLGVVHRDPRGPERLRAFLDHLRPDTVTVEVSNFALNYRCFRAGWAWELLARREKELLEEGLPPESVARVIEECRRFIEPPFEYRVASDWSRLLIPVIPIGISGFSRKVLQPNIRRLLELDSLRAAARQPPSNYEAAYGHAARMLAEPCKYQVPLLRLLEEDEGYRRRERLLARNLRRVSRSLDEDALVLHVGAGSTSSSTRRGSPSPRSSPTSSPSGACSGRSIRTSDAGRFRSRLEDPRPGCAWLVAPRCWAKCGSRLSIPGGTGRSL